MSQHRQKTFTPKNQLHFEPAGKIYDAFFVHNLILIKFCIHDT